MTKRPSIKGFIVEVEQEVLGALLLGGDFRKVASVLDEKHFIEGVHGRLFRTIREAHERYGSTTVPIVAKMVTEETAGLFHSALQISPVEYLAALVANSVHGPAGLEQSARAAVDQWARLAVGAEAERLQAAAADPRSNPAKLVAESAQVFDEVMAHVRRGPRRKTRVSIGDAAGNAIAASREAAQRGSGITGITWGLADVNHFTGGIQRRDLTIIAARPAMGKTTLGMSACLAAAKSGVGAGIISLEMDADKLGARAVTDLAYDWAVKVPYSDIIRGKAEPADLDAIEAATKDIRRLPLWIEEQPSLSMSDIRLKAEAMMEAAERAGSPIELLAIDHLGLIKPSARYQGNRVQEVSEITAGLKSMARELGIAVIALSQLSRAVETRNEKRPQLSDLRESGSIEQDADVVIFLYREAYYLERERGDDPDAEAKRTNRLLECQNKLEFIIAKQRNGRVTTVDLFADMACSAIRNAVRT